MVKAYTKTVTERQAEANRANGRLGGRPKGKISQAVADARKVVGRSLQEACQANELRHVARKQPASARIGAISLLFDRGRGKAVQPEHHSGNMSLTVITGVPEPDEILTIIEGETVPAVAPASGELLFPPRSM